MDVYTRGDMSRRSIDECSLLLCVEIWREAVVLYCGGRKCSREPHEVQNATTSCVKAHPGRLAIGFALIQANLAILRTTIWHRV